jgi:hypothetical protein
MRKILSFLLLILISLSAKAESQFIVSSYVRGNFYNRGDISSVSIRECNDLICKGAQPDALGNLVFEKYYLHDGYGASNFSALVDSLKRDISGENITLRLGVSGGDKWKYVLADNSSRESLIRNILSAIKENDLNGVDIDFEWAYTKEEFDSYSAFIIQLKKRLGGKYILSISLSPISYRISQKAIEATDFISLQCYGPRPLLFHYADYVKAIDEVLNYGVPSSKLLPGLPFYGVLSNGDGQPVSYRQFVSDGLVESMESNRVRYDGKSYIINGVESVMNKTHYAYAAGCAGIMFWDLADDVPFSNPLSLLRAVRMAINESE